MLEGILEYDVVNGVPMSRFDGINGTKLYCVNTMNEWRAFFQLLRQQKLVACDTETEGFRWYKGHRICGMSFGWGLTHFYVPVRHKSSLTGGAVDVQLNMDDIRSDLQEFFGDKTVTTLWHNKKFDEKFYRADGIEIKTLFHDTRILWQLFDENAPGALKTIASGWKDELGNWHKGIVHKDANSQEKLLDRWRTDESLARRKAYNAWVKEQVEYSTKLPENQGVLKRDLKARFLASPASAKHEYYSSAKDDVDYSYIPIALMCKYAGIDTYLTFCVYKHVMHNMPMTQRVRALYINELKLSKVLTEAEIAGVKIDRRYLELLGTRYDEEILQIQEKIKAELGPINLGSNQQLADALIARGVTLTKRTPAGALSVDAKVLKKLASKHPIIKSILELRATEKLRSTYVTGILEKLTDDDMLHCSFNQNVSTGRMSSNDPNLQNIPGRDKSIRKAFICLGDEWLYLLCDYSQVEVRLTAHYSQDPLLLEAYARDQDVHTRTMCEMFNFPYEQVAHVISNELKDHPQYSTWDTLRTIAKRINFGIIYGVGAPGLSEQIPRPEQYKDLSEVDWIKVCQMYIDQYLDKYRGVKKFINQSGRLVKEQKKISNHFGRVRNLPWVDAVKIYNDPSKFWLEARAKRQGTNFVVQGTAADLFKFAVVRVAEVLKGCKSHIVNFVHDEIQIYLHKSEMHLIPKIKEAMESFPDFTVPIVADVTASTTNWAEKKKL